MPAQASVAVVILNYNGKKYLEQFLPSVLASEYDNLQVIIGDNASTDDSIAFLQERYPQVPIIRNEENYGFAGGYNRILERVQADYFVLLNSDVEVSKDWIQPVIALMEKDAHIAASQPKILSYKNKQVFEHAGAAGGFIDKFGFCFCRGRIFFSVEEDKGQYQEATEIFWASGAALFIRAERYREMGGLDADFFAHMEEIDLCWRLKNKGYSIYYCPYSTVYHVGGGTLEYDNPRKIYLNFRNNLVMMQKNIPGFWNAFSILFIRFWFDLAAYLRFISEGKWSHAWAVNKAHTHFLLGIFKVINKRLKVQRALQDQPVSALYSKSIVLDYFFYKKTVFSSLDEAIFSAAAPKNRL